MRIVHVTDVYLPRLGGIEMHVHDLAVRQRRDGHDVHVVTATAPGSGPGAEPDPPWLHRVANPAVTVPRQLGLGPQVGALLASADAVHAHVSVVSPFAFGAARLAGSLGRPTLVTVHSLWTRLGPLPALGSRAAGLRSWPVLWSAVSDAAAEPVRRVLGPSVEVLVLPNAVDVAAWQVPGGAPAVPTVVSVMRLARTKRPLPLARILRATREEVPDHLPLRAVVVGDGPQRPGLERHLRRHDLDGWVELRGRLDRPAIREVLARSTVYLAPAELESFGIAALEARAAGLPVVASSHGGVGTFITHGVDGLLGDSDDALVAHLVRLLTDEVTTARMTAHNRSVPPPFGWDAACGRALAAYDLAAGRSRTRVAAAPARAAASS
ncbi:glycosyltransferase family 4 protein [Nocardioides sp. KIGAM211]|uniref:Glycosyltransferase family 4 protein n=1 Tax=Nocardioides luti TaxID=2761101 RepID=A0A7X0REU0_9ACTN|nr:glycosyltransferase family 4 protein [Nocardioides luti]MBB6626994.1 glycosyltransferase family 4 protein [Nocardioides luti]